MRKVSYQDILFIDDKNQGFCLSFYASNHMELARLIDEAKLVARQDLGANEFEQLFGHLDATLLTIDIFPVAVFINSSVKCYVPLFNCHEELFVISTSFHLKPLMKLHQRNKDVAVLHFSDENVKLYQISIKNISLLDVFETPNTSSDYDNIDRCVSDIISKNKLLLIFSGKQECIDEFKKICMYGHYFNNPLPSIIKIKNKDMIRHIFKHIEPYFRELESRTTLRFETAKMQGRLVSDPNEILQHALNGDIKILFIAEDKKLWGYLDVYKKVIRTNPKQMDCYDDDILDDLSEIVLKAKGSVVVLPQSQMPDSGLIFGILRDPYEKIIYERKTFKAIS